MNSLALKDVDNEVLNEADEYLRKHKILELFEVRQMPTGDSIRKSASMCNTTNIACSKLTYLSQCLLGFNHSFGIQATRQCRTFPSAAD